MQNYMGLVPLSSYTAYVTVCLYFMSPPFPGCYFTVCKPGTDVLPYAARDKPNPHHLYECPQQNSTKWWMPHDLGCVVGGTGVNIPQVQELSSMHCPEHPVCLSTMHCSSGSCTQVVMLGSLLPKSHKDATVEEETIHLMLIAPEMTKMPYFLFLLFFFFCRVKLVLLVLLVLVVVLEREENLVLRVMLGHPGLRYINNTWSWEVLCHLLFTEP